MLVFVDESKVNKGAFHYYQCLHKLEQHILANYPDETISLSTAAAVMVMEKTYCSSFFRRKVGVPFTVWLSLVRLRVAAQKLASCDCRISEVAYAVGFGDIRTFERNFKRQTSLTPREYVVRVRSDLVGAPTST
jgi:AraC-like DNA-binding protein